MRYPRFALIGLLALAAMLAAALAARDSVEADDPPPAHAPVGTPTVEVDHGKGPRAGDIIPGRYVVRLKDRASPKAVAARHGLRPEVEYESALKGFAGRLSDKDVERLRADPNVASIEPDTIVTADDQTLPTGVDRIDADLNTAAKIDGIDDLLDVDIAIIDTGIQPDHPDLRVVGGTTFLGETCSGVSWADDNGHGTHVAGTAAALDNDIGVVGVAPGARLWAVKVLDSSGSGSTSCVIAGIDWVTANADTIEVANMSLGGSASKCDAIASSAAAGVVYAVSAGNSAQDVGSHSPANCPDVLTTSAIADFDGKPGGLDPQTVVFSSCEMTGDDVFACFSNFGSLVDIAAPGVKILSTYIGSSYAIMSGTSMASPHVAGAAALDIVVHGKPTDAAGAAAVRNRIVAEGAPQMGPLGFSGDPDLHAEPLLFNLWSSDEHDVAVMSVSVPATFAQGDPVPVSALVANRGGSSETFSVSLAASDGAVSGSPQTVTLDTHTITTLTFTWDTAGLAPGDYTLTATADTVPGETNTADNTALTVVSIKRDVSVTEISTPPLIAAGDIVSVDVTAANPGDFSETFEVSLTASGGSVGGSPQPVALAGGASTTLSFTWDTTGLAPGDYTLTATASTVPGETNTTNNSAEVTVTLLVHDVAVTAMNAPSVVVEGDIVSVAVAAANLGDFSETFEVSLTASGGSVGDSPQPVTLGAGASTTLTFTWDTAGLAPGDYTLTATASTVPGETNTADNSLSAEVTVRLPEHDVAVTAIDAPSAVVEGDSVSVGVTAANPGTFSESFEVSLSASGGSVSGSPQSVALEAGASTRLTFTWETAGAGPGTHTLTATAATVTGETNSADNTLAKSLPVMASPSFVVNSALDPGSGGCSAVECTLRGAITAANASAGAEVIWFDIGPGGPQTITPLTALPMITDPVVIDGTTQPGYAGTPIIELDGSKGAGGLHITAGSSTVKGLVINRLWPASAIYVDTGGGNIIQGNYIGTDKNGTTALGNFFGVRIWDSSSNIIGGSAAGEGNIISGNWLGVFIGGSGATGNVVQGNYIGTDVTGTADLGNTFDGISIFEGTGNTIGGTTEGARNVISGNDGHGVVVVGSGNLVQGNTIAHNDGDGVRVDGASTTGNTVRGNSIHSNVGQGIENTNGGNMELAPPVIDSVGSASGTACANCTVDIYSDDEDEGGIYHGSTVADGGGDWSFPGAVVGPNITATATDASGNTSEFSAPFSCDSDSDSICDSVDNCPFVPNGPAEAGTPGVGNQTNTDADNEAAGFRLGAGVPPPILVGDADGDACDDDDDNDGFSDADERAIYQVSAGSAEEHTPCRTDTVDDPWPPDLPTPDLPDRVVDISDLGAIVNAGLFTPSTGKERFNLYVDGFIDVQDLNAVVPFLFQSCQPPP